MENNATELDREREQMRKLTVLQKTAALIVKKWLWLLFLFFVFFTGIFSGILVYNAKTSGRRFETTTQLLYNPRQIAKLQNMGDRQLMSILNRGSLKAKIADVLEMPPAEIKCIHRDLELVQGPKPSNLFTLTAWATTRAGAIKKANAYAEVLIDEYEVFRKQDLAAWRESLESRRERVLAQIEDCETEMGIQKAKTGVAAPVETLTTTTTLLSDQRRNLSELEIKISNEERRKKNLETVLGGDGAAITGSIDGIRSRAKRLEELDSDIAKLREKYMDKHHILAGKLEERETLAQEYASFLADRGLAGVELDAIEKIAKTARELSEVNQNLEVLNESRGSLERAVARSEKRCSELTAIIPVLERLKVKRTDLDTALREMDGQLDELSNHEHSVRNDLRQIEIAEGAYDNNPFRTKNFILAAGGAGICVAALSFWILALEFLFGNIAGGRELKIYKEIEFLGSLPGDGAMSETAAKDVLGVVARKFAAANSPKGVVLLCRLPGSGDQAKFFEELKWSFAMSGETSFFLDVVLEGKFQGAEEDRNMLNMYQKGDNGWYPVENRFTMEPAELQMLVANIAELRGQFDHVFVSMDGGLPRGGSFFDQMLSVCESVLVVAASGKSPRSWLGYALRHGNEAHKPFMAIVTGGDRKTVEMEMESR